MCHDNTIPLLEYDSVTVYLWLYPYSLVDDPCSTVFFLHLQAARTKKLCENNIRPPAPVHTPANKVSDATVAIAKERLRQFNR